MSITQESVVAPAGTWQLDPVHSTVGFEVEYLAGTFKGQFREIAASIEVEDGRTAFEGTAKVESVDVKDENLAAHLRSPEFFDAARHPELQFEAEEIRPDGDKVSGQGTITIKGATKPVKLTGTTTGTITDPYGRERVGLTLTAAVDRTDFGLNWNNPLPSGEPALADEVVIVAELQFVKAA
jgi:polyisoprenoid-binding protein YceI